MSIMWSVLSALFVLALWGMSSLLSERDITLDALQWLVYLAWLLWTLFGIALVRTFVSEGERRAVRLGALIFGGVSGISAVLLSQLWIF